MGGYPFSAFVNEFGYVLIGHDFGNGTGNLPVVQNTDTLTRSILMPEILLSMTDIAEVRISSSSGGTDVINTSDSIIWRVQNNMSLHRGALDTTINSGWVGVNADGFTAIPTVICGPFDNNTLDKKIVHPCGDYNSFVWYPQYNYQREDYWVGEVPDNERFELWVKGTPCSAVFSDEYIVSCTAYTWIDGITYTENTDTSTYTFQTISGCDSIITLHLDIHEVDVTVTTSGFTLSANNSGQQYQWMDCNNGYALITGETGQSFSPSSDGDYAVQINDGICTDTSDCVTVMGLDVNNFENDYIQIYPNPTSDRINILSKDPSFEIIGIYNLSGQNVLPKTKIHSYNIIDVSELAPGSYFIHVNVRETIIQLNFIKQ